MAFSNDSGFWKSFKGNWFESAAANIHDACQTVRALETGIRMTIMSIWNHIDFPFECYLCICFRTYDLYFMNWVSRYYLKPSMVYYFCLKKNTAQIKDYHEEISPGKRSVICSKPHQSHGPHFFQYGRPRLVRAAKAWATQKNNFLFKIVLNIHFKEIKIWSLDEKNIFIYWRGN